MSRKISALMLDLSGTIHIDDLLIPGAKEAILLLAKHSVPVQFVTNNSKESNEKIVEKLEKAGLKIDQKDVFSSLNAAQSLVARENLRPLLLLEDSAAVQFSEINKKNPNCVVIGLAPHLFHYDKLNEAFQLAKSGGRIIAVNKSRYFKKGSDLVLGTGAFVAGLEYSCDCKAEIVGKPSESFFSIAVSRFSDIDANEVMMVGDDIRDDVIGAQKAGLQGGLVQTGKYLDGDESKYEERPDYVFSNLLEMAKFVTEQY